MRRISHQRRRRAAAAFPDALELAVAGDGAGFEALFQRYSSELLEFARARGAEDADALVSECLVRAFKRIGEFVGDERHFRAWLFTICRNLLIDDVRRRARRPVNVDDGLESTDVRASDDPAETATNTLSGEDLIAVLAELTDDQQEVVALRILADLPIAEVARIVGKPESAVKALQHRGLRTLSKKLSRQPVSPGKDAALTKL